MRLIYSIVVFFFVNIIAFGNYAGLPVWTIPVLFVLYLMANIFPSISNRRLKSRRMRMCGDGCELLRIFMVTTLTSLIFSASAWTGMLPGRNLGPGVWTINTVCAVLLETVLFCNGIIRIYLTSAQLGIRWRVLGVVCGWIPVVNVVVLSFLIHNVQEEMTFETGA